MLPKSEISELPINPHRIVLIRTCCIGDVVMATAAFHALRRKYPYANISWAVGDWSRQVVETWLPDVTIMDSTNITSSGLVGRVGQLTRRLRSGEFELAVSLVRSPVVSAAVLLSGIPYRAGIDSEGRGFGYNIRVPIDAHENRHEVDIYLDVVRALGINTDGIRPRVPISDIEMAHMWAMLQDAGIRERYLIVNPSGGKNPGGQMDVKRYPPPMLARLVNLVAPELGVEYVMVVAGPGDEALVEEVAEGLVLPHSAFVGNLTFRRVGALARGAALYIGNDTGFTHIAAAAGAKTAMLLGPTDPARYAPYAPDAVALWKPRPLPPEGFAAGPPPDWNWARDGISPEDGAAQILAFLAERRLLHG